MRLFSKLSLLERYIITELISPFLFGLAACTIVSELIGISFEQTRFIVNRGLTISTSLYIHALKLPAFIALALPITILMATIFTYGKLSRKSEIVAFQSYGISLYRLIIPALATSLIVTFIMFLFNEIIVPPANYEAAITLEKAMNVNRVPHQTHDIIFSEFSQNNYTDKLTPGSYLKVLFYAEKFTGEEMQEITLLIFNQQGLKEIIKSDSAKWNHKQKYWVFNQGVKTLINPDGSYGTFTKFEKLSLNLSRTPLDLAKHNFDNREMNIFQAYKRLSILKKTGDEQSIRKLEVSIQEKYAIPFSCFVFALFGSALGINPQPKVQNNAFGITIIILFGYYMIRMVATGLGTAGIISIFWGVWLPNILGASIGCFLLVRKSL
ncbi:MAG: LptF/LptG family permease [Nostocales cyanobacterium 94392]|nr:LptF/LptG family permease [Nostocales cyanobacterium 94392]